MDDRNEEILRQYDLKIYNTYRARGALLLDTNDGYKLFKSFDGSKNRLAFENRVKEHLIEKGYGNVDLYVKNTNGDLITEDTSGGKYIIKNWFQGEECNLREQKDIKVVANNLAVLHNLMKEVELTEEQLKFNTFHSLSEVYDKHNRELKRVKGYIKDKRQKNEFEICFLSCYDVFYEQGQQAVNILRESNYRSLLEKAVEQKIIIHGNYTYHNVLLLGNGIATTNFDKSCLGVQLTDLYLFIRKVMEKNNWDQNIGHMMLEIYSQEKPLSKDEIKILYVLLRYPEKFWKITNFYYNGKKSWVPQRNIQKLISIQEQQKEKEEFLEYLKQCSYS